MSLLEVTLAGITYTQGFLDASSGGCGLGKGKMVSVAHGVD